MEALALKGDPTAVPLAVPMQVNDAASSCRCLWLCCLSVPQDHNSAQKANASASVKRHGGRYQESFPTNRATILLGA